MIRGTCGKQQLIDLTENFMLYEEAHGGLIKISGKNHQFLGVTTLLPHLRQLKKPGRLGVFWHTQGSGKSFSMAFFPKGAQEGSW